MARMTVEEIYRGEKYNVMSAATANYLMNGASVGVRRTDLVGYPACKAHADCGRENEK